MRKGVSSLLCVLELVLVLGVVACGGSGGNASLVGGNPESGELTYTLMVESEGMRLGVLKDASGTPKGVRISWTRVDVDGVQGYYIYRDTKTIPGGDPAGKEALRINDGNIIGQSGTGTETLTFDDIFNPNVGDKYYYRMTVVNATSDESDFSDELNITIAEHVITTVSQAGGSIGDEVTITGNYFGADQESDKVYFSDSDGNIDVEATTYVSWSMTEIVVEIPYGAGDGKVGVEVGGTTVNSPDGEVVDYNEPALTTLSPTEDWVQHDYIKITGTDFGPPPSSGGSDTFVYFGSTKAAAGDIDENTWTTTNIDVKVPSGASGGTVDVKVDVAGNESGTLPFMVLPHIDSLSIEEGNVGVSVTLNGTNFGATQGSGKVEVNGVNASITSWGNTSVVITIPDAATDGDVVLTRDDTKVTNGIGFDVIPTITGVSPKRLVVGDELTIDGSGFGNARGASTVTFDGGSGTVVTEYTSWANDQIVVVAPAGAETGTVTVDIDDNSVGSNKDSATSSDTVAILLPPPDLTDVGQL